MIECPNCGGEEQGVLGRLGRFVWFRCRACGTDHAVPSDEVYLELDELLDDALEGAA